MFRSPPVKGPAPIRCSGNQWPPRVQVAGVSTLEEARFCSCVGVDAVGFTLELPTGIHDGLTQAKARAILCQMPPRMSSVLITYLRNGLHAARLVEKLGVTGIQFHGGIDPAQIRLFRRLSPHTKTIAAITVIDESAIELVRTLSPQLWDAIILDSFDPETGKKGATGLTHDWSVSARIVRIATLPVILAGGLHCGNVAEAIARVNPAGVDAHTGLENPDGSRNFVKIASFARSALEAFHRC